MAVEVVRRPSIAILGSGPSGLEAALAAAESGYRFTVYEAADSVAGGIRTWGHVRLFTPWSMNVSDRMAGSLASAGEAVPSGDECPTGAELVAQLLDPVSQLPTVLPNLRCGVRVVRVGREGLLKHEEIGTGRRIDHPFRLLLRGADGSEWTEAADVVIDCTGNAVPNPAGEAGIPAPGEEAASDRIEHVIPDVASDESRWMGRTTLVVGGGHSAQNAVRDLVELSLSARAPDTAVVWVLRGGAPSPIDEDPLPERLRLTRECAALAENPPGTLRVFTDAVVDHISSGPQAIVRLRHGPGNQMAEVAVDHILALTGRIGDHQIYRELQFHECWATSGPMKLAAALLGESGGGGDCLDTASLGLGAETLTNPEPGFFVLGIKSYGRRNDYLMRVGWKQVADVFGLLDAM